MVNMDDVATRWVDRIHGRTARGPLRGSHLFESGGDEIFSWGSHFTVAHVNRNKDGSPALVLLNGDRYSVSTTRHQNTVRNAVDRAGLTRVIIPFSALEASGVVLDSVRLLHATADHWEQARYRATVLPPEYCWGTRQVGGYRDLTEAELAEQIAVRQARADQTWQYARRYHQSVARKEHPRVTDEQAKVSLSWLDHNPRPHTATIADIPARQRRVWQITGEQPVIRTRNGGAEADVGWVRLPDGTTRFEWTTRRHWLGESLIVADVTYPVWARCRRCNGTGSYAATWAGQVQEYRCSCQRGARPGREPARKVRRNVKFLSGFDHNEARRAYFFCELPKCDAVTIDAAYEALKPDTVRVAEQGGLTVRRQGDIFAIAIPNLTTPMLTRLGAIRHKRGQLLGTNHTATETATLPDGRLFARGFLRHQPVRRAPDHAMQNIGRTWHLIVKNTVPLTRTA
jgi:hypothetical protein